MRGVPLDTEDAESGMTALQRAVFYGQIGVVRTLIMVGNRYVQHSISSLDMHVSGGREAECFERIVSVCLCLVYGVLFLWILGCRSLGYTQTGIQFSGCFFY